MKALYLLTILTFFGSIQVLALGEGQNIHNLKASEKPTNWKLLQPINDAPKTKLLIPKRRRQVGNLPLRLVRRRKSKSSIVPEKAIHYPELGPVNKSGVGVGDTFKCIIEQDIKAYVGSKAPVKARVLSGPHRGEIFVGNAVMDPKTKNILIWFDLLMNHDSGQKHKLVASILSSGGEVGLVGTHHSKYWRHFFATVLSRATEGYAQASVQRTQNFFGNYQQVPNPENAGKAAIASAASETADAAADEMRNAPEFATIKGPIQATVFVTEKPTLIH